MTVTRYRRRQPDYMGVEFDGSNEEDIRIFVRDDIRRNDWEANGLTETEGEYRPIILRDENGKVLYNLGRDGYTILFVGDIVIVSDDGMGDERYLLRQVKHTKEELTGFYQHDEDIWTQKDFFSKYYAESESKR